MEGFLGFRERKRRLEEEEEEVVVVKEAGRNVSRGAKVVSLQLFGAASSQSPPEHLLSFPPDFVAAAVLSPP